MVFGPTIPHAQSLCRTPLSLNAMILTGLSPPHPGIQEGTRLQLNLLPDHFHHRNPSKISPGAFWELGQLLSAPPFPWQDPREIS